MFCQRRVGGREWAGHHRSGRQHAAFPGQTLHLTADGDGAVKLGDGGGRIGGEKRLAFERILLGDREHVCSGERAERRRGKPPEERAAGCQDAGCPRPRRCKHQWGQLPHLLLHVCRHGWLAAEQYQRLRVEVFECHRHATRHTAGLKWSEARRADLPCTMRLRHAGHEDGERSDGVGHIAVIMPGHDL